MLEIFKNIFTNEVLPFLRLNLACLEIKSVIYESFDLKKWKLFSSVTALLLTVFFPKDHELRFSSLSRSFPKCLTKDAKIQFPPQLLESSI